MLTSMVRSAPVEQSQALLWALLIRHEFVMVEGLMSATENEPVGSVGRFAGVDIGIASAGLVVVTVAVGALKKA